MSLDRRVEFKAIRVDWTVLRLENGSVYKVNSPLVNLIPVEGGTKMEFKPVSYLDPVEEDKGAPSEDPRIQETDYVGDVKFSITKETTDIYETEGRTIVLVSHDVNRLRRTNKFDQSGIRMYTAEIALQGAVVLQPKKQASEAKPLTDATKTQTTTWSALSRPNER